VLPNAALEGTQTQQWRTWQKVCMCQIKLENAVLNEKQALCDQLRSFLNGVWWATDLLLELLVQFIIWDPATPKSLFRNHCSKLCIELFPSYTLMHEGYA